MTDHIYLHEMVFFGRHGVTEEERAEPQPITVELDVVVDLGPAGRSDDLADTVDYGDLFRVCQQVVEEGSFHLLEGIAETIAADVLAGFPAVQSVSARVKKPALPFEGQLDHAGIAIERARG